MRQKIYVDMDGVIADHFNHLGRMNGYDNWKDIPDIETAHTQLFGTDYFFNVPNFWGWTENGSVIENKSAKLVNFVRDIGERCGFDYAVCSSPLKGDFNNSAYWKRRWLEYNGYMPNSVNDCVFTLDKSKYATARMVGLPNILIDDRPDNIRKFNAAGGVGIRFQHDKDDLEEYLFEAIKECMENL